MSILFIFFVSLLIIGLFNEIAHEHDRKILRIAENATKEQKIRLIKLCYFEITKREIRKSF